MSLDANKVPVADAYEDLRKQAVLSRNFLRDQQRPLMVAPACSALVGMAVVFHLTSVIGIMNTLRDTPGLGAYAAALPGKPIGYDVVAEINALTGAMALARDSLLALIPANANGFALVLTVAASGPVWRDFSQAQYAPAVALVDSVIAAIAAAG